MTKDQVTIVTGGGRGIGREVALRMSRETSVFIVGRTRSDLASTTAEICARGGSAGYLVGDIADRAVAFQAIEKIRRKGWKVRNLVLNAGIAKGGPAHEFDPDLWERIFAVNVHGNFWFAQACLPEMVANRGGYLCFINSILGVKGRKYDAAYSASKHAQVGLARSIAQEYAKHGIVSIPICPSFVDTEMTRSMFPGLAKHRGISLEEAEALIASQNPQKRIIPPSEIAAVVAFICCGQADSMNGQPLILGGGEQ